MSRRLSEKVAFINLGCARNLVDGQVILGRLKAQGHTIVPLPQAHTVILNTCCFIQDAKQESIDALLDLVYLKKKGKIKRVIVAGCLSERYGRDLLKEIKGIDAVMGVEKLAQEGVPREYSLTPPHSAYVKICESCYNHCSFCIIPRLKGRFVSRSMDSVITQVKKLDKRGVQEINLIGQDITAYGLDLYGQLSLSRLLQEILNETRRIRWIRLLYTYPSHITDELIDAMASDKRICKYIDIPIQHISARILKLMNRRTRPGDIRKLIEKIRQRIPDVFLRTTVIVGFPSETQKDFESLLRFIKRIRFERLGAFTYSREEGTPAYDFAAQVPAAVKKRRLEILMTEQQRISEAKMSSLVGKTIQVLIDEKPKEMENVYMGRSEYDAPEVDGIVYIESHKKLKVGEFVSVRITDSSEYDLMGTC